MEEIRPFVDFKAIKARVSMLDILARYRFTVNRVNQLSSKGDCPLPTHSSGSKNTFFINEAKRVWYCHSDSCKRNGNRAGGNAIDFVSLMEGCSVYAAAKLIDGWFPAEREQPHPPTAAMSDRGSSANRSAGTDNAAAQNKPLTFTLKDVNPEHPMIQGRGISIATAREFGVGLFPGKGSMADRIVFPLRERGNVVGYAGRTTLPTSETNPKWLFGKGLRKTFVYALERCVPQKAVIICESLWAPLWFYEQGAQAVALMGSEMTEEQELCLDPFPMITVALDNDQAGIEKTARILERLKMKHHIRKAWLIG